MRNVNIPEDKRQRIITSAMECFSKSGYKKTSVDEIVEKAEISKGLIFHYFGNKSKLYLYLYKLAYEKAYSSIESTFSPENSDLFTRIGAAGQAKLELKHEFPYIIDFLMSARKETDLQITAEINKIKNNDFSFWIPSFLDGIDRFKLKDEFEPEKIINIIIWCSRGLTANKGSDFELEEALEEMNDYLEILRTAFYKEEYL